jgi:hypothetical protein
VRRYAATLAVLAWAGVALAGPVPCDVIASVSARADSAPLAIKGEDVYPAFKQVRLTAENAPVGYTIIWDVHPFGVADKATNVRLRSVVEFVAPPGVYVVQVRAIKDEDVREATKTVTIGEKPPGPGPTPQPPEPKPPEPKPPAPVTSFRVLYVVETGGTLTAAQNSTIYAKSVRDYLAASTTPEGGLPGFRVFDKDHEAGNEPPTVKALWAAVRPQVTAVPCVAIEVNGKVTIEPLPETPAAAVALFKKYRGDK